MRIWKRSWTWVGAALALTLVGVAPAAAEPPAPAASPTPERARASGAQKAGGATSRRRAAKSPLPPGYTQVIEEAFREFELGNYAEARSRFLQAHELYPSAPTLRVLGMVEFELKNYVASVAYLEQALQSLVRPLGSEARAATEQLLADARGYLAHYTVALRPTHATLLLNGQPLTLDAAGTLLLPVGDHVLEAHAPGYHPARRVVRVLSGTNNNKLDILLLPLNEQRTSARVPLYKNKWLWTGVGGAVVVGAVTGLALGLRRPDPAAPSGGTEGAVLYVPPK